MLGALVGDVIGSAYEHLGVKTKRFDFHHPSSGFTDDTVLTVAVAAAILSGEGYGPALRRFGNEYPSAGYGGNFRKWLADPEAGPYGSWGNGSAMRASPVSWAFESEDQVLEAAAVQAAVTHNHPEGIRGAQAAALAVFLARKGRSKAEIAARVGQVTGYSLDRSYRSVRKGSRFEIRCEKSVPEALICFLESRDFDDALRNAIALGGDADTQASIAGAVAEAFYGGVPEPTARFALSRISPWLLAQALPFLDRYGLPWSAAQVRARHREVEALVADTPAYSVSHLEGITDALELTFYGPTLARGTPLRNDLSKIILGGWSRILADLSKVGPIDGPGEETLEFLRKSCRIREGLLVRVQRPEERLGAVQLLADSRKMGSGA